MLFLYVPITFDDLGRPRNGAHREPKCDDTVSDRNDDDEIRRRKIENKSACRFNLELHEGNGGSQEEITNDGCKKVGNDIDDFSVLFRRQPVNKLYFQMSAFTGGDRRPQKSEPKHQMPKKNITPFNSRVKKVSQKDLAECHQDHDAEKNDDQPSGNAGEPPIDVQKQSHLSPF